MLEFFLDYGLFLLKALTVVAAVGVILITVAVVSRRDDAGEGIQVEKMNDKYRQMADVLRRAILTRRQWKDYRRETKKVLKQKEKAATSGAEKDEHRIFVLDFKCDTRATQVSALREEISTVVAVAGASDEVVVRLENAGGPVQDHGLAASQLQRLVEKGIQLTVVVDKVAASGGYLMACVADKLVAAPFAIVGSIGVLAQLPNFHRFLEARGVDYEQITAGQFKRTVTMFGTNTEEDRAKLKEELEDVHAQFKSLVADSRSDLDIESVATGETWLGSRAQELGLVDELGTSDSYLMDAVDRADIYHVEYKSRPNLRQRLHDIFDTVLEQMNLWFPRQDGRSQL